MLQREMNLQLHEMALLELHSVRPAVSPFFCFNLTQLQGQSLSLYSCQERHAAEAVRQC